MPQATLNSLLEACTLERKDFEERLTKKSGDLEKYKTRAHTILVRPAPRLVHKTRAHTQLLTTCTLSSPPPLPCISQKKKEGELTALKTAGSTEKDALAENGQQVRMNVSPHAVPPHAPLLHTKLTVHRCHIHSLLKRVRA